MAERGQRVILVPCPFQGHINPMLQLGTILHSKGFFITVIHTEMNFPNPSNPPEFDFQSIPDNISLHEISTDNIMGILDIISGLNSNCQTPLQECLVQMMEKQSQDMEKQSQDTEISCIVYDELMFFSESVARHLKLPSIILRTTSAANFMARITYVKLKSQGYSQLQDSMPQDPVPQIQTLRFKDLPLFRIAAPESFLQLMATVSDVRKSSAVIWNTTNCIEKSLLEQIQRQCQVPIFPIGPLHKFAPTSSSGLLEEDTSCITWLNKHTHNSVLYVSLGSLATMEEAELKEMAWGLANSKQPFLWVIRPGLVNGSEWIEFLPPSFSEATGERGHIVKWAPQKQVLGHDSVRGFWSHCGWNSTLESIAEGVPMICKPSFGDQMVNARYVSHEWKIGLQLENRLEREEVELAIRRLMVDEEGEEMKRRAMSLKNKVEQSVGNGGSSNNYSVDLIKLMLSF